MPFHLPPPSFRQVVQTQYGLVETPYEPEAALIPTVYDLLRVLVDGTMKEEDKWLWRATVERAEKLNMFGSLALTSEMEEPPK